MVVTVTLSEWWLHQKKFNLTNKKLNRFNSNISNQDLFMTAAKQWKLCENIS
jgi:hypothetical protein